LVAQGEVTELINTHANTLSFLVHFSDQPVHLYDAYSATVRATYRPYNALDEMESPNIVSFSPDGQRIFAAGFKSDRVIHVFDTNVPGRDSTELRLGKSRRSSDGQKGLLSALAFSPVGSTKAVFCVGTYAPGSIYLYDDRLSSGQASVLLNGGVSIVGHGRNISKKRRFVVMSDNEEEGGIDRNLFSAAKAKWYHTRARGGVTQLQFSPTDDFVLYSASRRSDAVLAWDLRMVSGNADHTSVPIHGMASYATDSDTNQRLQFDLDDEDRRIFIGGRDRCVRIYDTKTGKLKGTINGLSDAVNGVSYHRYKSNNVENLAVAIGSRRFPVNYDSEEDGSPPEKSRDHSVPGALELYQIQLTHIEE
jgi:WD40 repeat protein